MSADVQSKPEDDDRSAPGEPALSPLAEPKKFFVVGVGASAGGLEAVAELIKHVPFDSMAFVVVQHLAPNHESLLTQLLARATQIEVVTAADGMVVEPNRVYVIPPNTDLALLHGTLHLIAPGGGYGPRLPIDFFFRSLAEDLGSFGIGVVLSGTGTDGTFGLKAIKAAGGITFAQEPATAKYDGMPRSAISSGYADFCLDPAGIAAELDRISKDPNARPRPRTASQPPLAQEQLAKLFVLIRSEFGNDLSDYKPGTIERRVERRMTLHKLSRLEDYVRYVQSAPDELRALYTDMLITVTSFFRDREPFEALKAKVFPHLVAGRDPHQPIRLWVPACATGEEAYSLAICLAEFLDGKSSDLRVQIFGTDVDDDSVEFARRGLYPENITLDVSPERLSRFFIKRDAEYQVTRRIRDMVVFSKQNLLKDAPFSRIDVVSCRNLLIYLQPAAQRRALGIFHYALNPTGVLLLGTSETVGDAPGFFSLLDRKNKLYAKKQVSASLLSEVGYGVSPNTELPARPAPPRPQSTLQARADKKVLELYGPPGVVINEGMDILQFRGHTGGFLDPAPGAVSFNLLRLARPELHIELKRCVQQALAENARVTRDVTYQDEGEPRAVKLDVLPLEDAETKLRSLIVLFQRLPSPRELPALEPADGAPDDRSAPLSARIKELERELALTKEYLQSTIDEKDSSNEELKSANEELQSSNEELQSTNEELETSKEEMQSTNEELTTVNDELQNRMAELAHANDDFHNVLAGVDVAVVIVGLDLRIRRYTAAAERLLNLVPADLGRSITFLEGFLGMRELGAKVTSVVDTLTAVEEEVLCTNQRWYALRITPYKTLDHAIRGSVVSLTDIDIRKRASELTRDVGAYASRFLAGIGHPLLILDDKLRVVWANEAFLDTFKVVPEETVGNLLFNVGQRQWADPELRTLLEGTVLTGRTFRDFRLGYHVQDGAERTLRVGGNRIPVLADTVMVLVSIQEEP